MAQVIEHIPSKCETLNCFVCLSLYFFTNSPTLARMRVRLIYLIHYSVP
jgi:hypothetical protein